MEHYYVVVGNEHGVELSTKKNFIELEDAMNYFEEVKYDNFGCVVMYVNQFGDEITITEYIND